MESEYGRYFLYNFQALPLPEDALIDPITVIAATPDEEATEDIPFLCDDFVTAQVCFARDPDAVVEPLADEADYEVLPVDSLQSIVEESELAANDVESILLVAPEVHSSTTFGDLSADTVHDWQEPVDKPDRNLLNENHSHDSLCDNDERAKIIDMEVLEIQAHDQENDLLTPFQTEERERELEADAAVPTPLEPEWEAVPPSREQPIGHHEDVGVGAQFEEVMTPPPKQHNTAGGAGLELDAELSGLGNGWDTEGDGTSIHASSLEVTLAASRGDASGSRLHASSVSPASGVSSMSTPEASLQAKPVMKAVIGEPLHAGDAHIASGIAHALYQSRFHEEMYHPMVEEVAADTLRVHFNVCARSAPPQPLRWDQAINDLRDPRSSLIATLNQVLRDLPVDAFSLEFAPATSRHLCSQRFEFIAKESFGPALDGCIACQPNGTEPDIIRENLSGFKGSARVKAFMASYGDAVLVAPAQATELCTPYTDMKAFLRSAEVPPEQCKMLWRHLGKAVAEVMRLRGTAWVRTDRDIAWLSLRVAWTSEGCTVASYCDPDFGSSLDRGFHMHGRPPRSSDEPIFGWLRCCSKSREEAMLAVSRDTEVLVRPTRP